MQHPLPPQSPDSEYKIDSTAALAFPSKEPEPHFFLSPLLRLPKSFGTTHVGEDFNCTLCVNNEARRGDDEVDKENSEAQAEKKSEQRSVPVSGAKVSAVMQTPSRSEGFSLDLFDASLAPEYWESSKEARSSVEQKRDSRGMNEEGVNLSPGETLQRMVKFALREEGSHTLAVTVTYTETPHHSNQETLGGTSEEVATEGGEHVRIFKKRYQFFAQQLLSVRTKIRPFHSKQPENKQGQARFVLEAQLENLSDITVVADGVKLLARSGLQCKSMNTWHIDGLQEIFGQSPVLAPGEVLQTCFLVEQTEEEGQWSQLERTKDGRTILGRLAIHWRGPMGYPGELTTNWLTSGKKQAAVA